MRVSSGLAVGPRAPLGSQLRLLLGCCLALLVPILIPLATGRVFTLNDLATFHIPIRFLYRDALRGGDSFLWSPALYSGLYLHGEGQAGMLHPLHLALYRFLPLAVGLDLEILCSYIAALTGAVWLLRRLGLSAEGAWFGAMVFAFSGSNLLHLMHVNAVAVVAHVPFVLAATHVLLTTTSRRAGALAFASIAMLIGSELLLGHPQYVWLTGVVDGYFVLCLVAAGVAPTRLLPLAGAVACGVLVGGAQLLPTMDALGASLRSSVSPAFRLSLSLHPWNLVQLWSAHTFRSRVYGGSDLAIPHELSVYNGAFCTLAFAWLVMRWRAIERKGLLAAYLGLAGIGLVLALGRYGGIYPLLSRVPGVNAFRVPARHVMLIHLALGGIAAVVFEDLLRVVREGVSIDARRFWPVAFLAGLSVVTCVATGALAQSSWAAAHAVRLSTLAQAAPWSGVFVATAVLLVLATRGVRWAIPALVILAAFDQGVWGYTYVYQERPRTIEQLAAEARAPAAARPGDLIDTRDQADAMDLGVLRRLHLTTGYVALVPATVLDPADPVARRIAGVAWEESALGWQPAPDPMPRARLVAAAQSAEDVGRAIHAVDIARVAVVSAPIGELSGPMGEARVVTDRPGRIGVETQASGRQLLVITERFHQGWRATEDGRDRPTVRVYGDYLGCVVSPGAHQVLFTFTPDSFRTGLRMSGLGLGLTMLVTALWWRKPRAPH